MTYVIAEPCVGVKDGSCVAVCPVDCIHPTPDEDAFATVDQLYIDRAVCIDCDICASVCPVDAIFEDEKLPERWRAFEELNARFYGVPA